MNGTPDSSAICAKVLQNKGSTSLLWEGLVTGIPPCSPDFLEAWGRRRVEIPAPEVGNTEPVVLNLPGRHNVLNALAACAITVELFPSLGKNAAPLFQALENFCPARRRFEIISEAGDILVISDYAHHPTEICALVAAAG